MAIGVPALILLAWMMIGHLVTLDDDMPGEWSNPEGSKKIWYASVGEFLIKAVLCITFFVLVYVP